MPIPNTTLEDAVQDWVITGSGLTEAQVIWADQPGPRPAVPYIAMSLEGPAPYGIGWHRQETNPLVLADDVVESVNGNFMTLTAHAYLTGDGPVQFTTTGTLPPGLALATNYWIIKSDANTIAVASTLINANAGTRISLGGSGTGTHTIVDTPNTLRVGQEVRDFAISPYRSTLQLQCFAATGTGTSAAKAILSRVMTYARLESQRARLHAGKAAVLSFGRITPIGGAHNVLFEPRAVMEIELSTVDSAEEFQTHIEQIEVLMESGNTVIVRDPD